MIDGLKLTFSGDELRTLLEKGIRRHEEEASRWTGEKLRTTEDETEDTPLLPQHICDNEAERHTWRANVLAFVRDHVDAGETYRLSAADLEYGELLPDEATGVGPDVDATDGFRTTRLDVEGGPEIVKVERK
jgi:hypothetical protein